MSVADGAVLLRLVCRRLRNRHWCPIGSCMYRLESHSNEAAAAGGRVFSTGRRARARPRAPPAAAAAAGEGEPAYTILTLVAEPEYRAAFDAVHAAGTGAPMPNWTVIDYARLAQRMVALFWPLVAAMPVSSALPAAHLAQLRSGPGADVAW